MSTRPPTYPSSWRERRNAYALSKDYTCEGCGYRNYSNHVHHLTYERVGAELDEDLELLCRACHAAAHHPIVFYDDYPGEAVA